MLIKSLNYKWFLLLLPLLVSSVEPAFAQIPITINSTTPCFLNQTAGMDLWKNCGADDDWLSFALLPFEWITGGYFSALLVSLFILMIWLKYHQIVYCFVVGLVFLPISFQFFPTAFWAGVIIFVVLGLAGGIFYMLNRQT
jgi:hypothetical protein